MPYFIRHLFFDSFLTAQDFQTQIAVNEFYRPWGCRDRFLARAYFLAPQCLLYPLKYALSFIGVAIGLVYCA